MLTGTINPCKRFFVEKYAELMLASQFGGQVHHKEVVIYCKISFLMNRGYLKLVRGNFIMTGFQRYA